MEKNKFNDKKKKKKNNKFAVKGSIPVDTMIAVSIRVQI